MCGACRWGRTCVFSVALVSVLVAGVHGDDEALLENLSRPGDPRFLPALTEWEAMDEADKIALLRRHLASAEESLASLAARQIGGAYLSLAEIHRQQALIRSTGFVKLPALDWGLEGGDTIGIPDMPATWRALAHQTDVPRQLDRLHRAIVPSHLPELVPLLDRGNKAFFRDLLWNVSLVAEHDLSDRYRAWAARGLYYGLERLSHLRRYTTAQCPALDPTPLEYGRAGLPAVFQAIARATWHVGDDEGFTLRQRKRMSPAHKEDVLPPRRFVHRWMTELVPEGADITFLTDVVKEPDIGLTTAWWAMRHLLRLTPDRGGDLVRGVASGDDARRLPAAAALAVSGFGGAWAELLDGPDVPEIPWGLRWAVDPVATREAWLEAYIQEEPSGLDRSSLVDPTLSRHVVYRYGCESLVKHLRWIALRLEADETAPLHAAVFATLLAPDPLTAERAARIADRLGPYMARGVWGAGHLLPETVLAALHAANPGATLAMLETWARSVDGESRLLPAVALARLGRGATLRPLVAELHVTEIRSLAYVPEVWAETALRRLLKSADDGLAGEAMAGLLLRAGIPPIVLRDRVLVRGGVVDPSGVGALRLLDAHDAVGALLALGAVGGRLGLIDDERVDDALQSMRDRRAERCYWEGTAGLALRGDPKARGELLGLVEDGRTWMYDHVLSDPVLLTCNNDTTFLARWIDHLESNCCLALRAQETLIGLYPTLPVQAGSSGVSTSAEVAAWFRARTFQYSPLAMAWLPVPQ